MRLRSSLLKKSMLSTAALFLSLSAASAVEANAVAERLKELLAGQGVDLTWTSVGGSGSAVTIEGTTLKVQGAEAAVPIGTVVLDDVADKDGGYRIGKATMPSYALSEEGLAVDVSSATLTGLTLPAAGATDPLGSFILYETADLASLSVKQGTTPLFTLDNLHVAITPPANGSPLEFTGSAEKLSADLSAVKDPASRKVIEALGYQTLSGTFHIAGTWQPTDGRMGLTNYDIAVDNAGKLSLAFDVGGYTPDFMKSLHDLQQKFANQPAGADNSAQGFAMLGLMQQLTFHGATIRFEDASLTGKVLDYIAKQQGQTPSAIVNQAKAVLPFLLAQLDNPELMKSVSQAVGTFLDDPKSLEIKASPAAPIPFAIVAANAIASPKDLPKTLGVTVLANQ